MKEKKSRMEIRLSEKDKKNIERYAKKCSVPVSEYVRQCALGFSPRQALPDDFYDLYSRLCDICNLINPGFTEDTERELISLITDIREQLLLPGKGAITWQPPASGP